MIYVKYDRYKGEHGETAVIEDGTQIGLIVMVQSELEHVPTYSSLPDQFTWREGVNYWVEDENRKYIVWAEGWLIAEPKPTEWPLSVLIEGTPFTHPGATGVTSVLAASFQIPWYYRRPRIEYEIQLEMDTTGAELIQSFVSVGGTMVGGCVNVVGGVGVTSGINLYNGYTPGHDRWAVEGGNPVSEPLDMYGYNYNVLLAVRNKTIDILFSKVYLIDTWI